MLGYRVDTYNFLQDITLEEKKKLNNSNITIWKKETEKEKRKKIIKLNLSLLEGFSTSHVLA